MVRIFASALILGLLALAPAAGRAQEYYRPTLTDKDIELGLRTDWYGVYLKDKKIGYFRAGRTRQGDNIVQATSMNMKLVSFGLKAEMNITETLTFESKAPYRLLKANYRESDSNQVLVVDAVRNEEGYTYKLRAGGQERSRQMRDYDYTLLDALASECWIRSGPKVGDQIVTRFVQIKEWKPDEMRQKILANKKSLVGGVEVSYYEVQNDSKKDMLSYVSREDLQGRSLSTVIIVFELRQEPEHLAKNTEFGQDLFVLGMAKINKGIGNTTRLENLVLDVGDKAADLFEDGPNQKISKSSDGTVQLRTGKASGKEVRATAKEIEENLEETTAYPISDAKIKELAATAVGDAQTPRDKVRRIVKFTHDFIRPQLTAALPNIDDLLRSKRGDCKSYALLANNLCRAAGIPAREVSGLLYMGDDQKSFGGHAWNEVVLDGKWVPIDASLNEVGVDAGHLCFGSEGRATKSLFNSLKNLSFKVVEVETK